MSQVQIQTQLLPFLFLGAAFMVCLQSHPFSELIAAFYQSFMIGSNFVGGSTEEQTLILNSWKMFKNFRESLLFTGQKLKEKVFLRLL